MNTHYIPNAIPFTMELSIMKYFESNNRQYVGAVFARKISLSEIRAIVGADMLVVVIPEMGPHNDMWAIIRLRGDSKPLNQVIPVPFADQMYFSDCGDALRYAKMYIDLCEDLSLFSKGDYNGHHDKCKSE